MRCRHNQFLANGVLKAALALLLLIAVPVASAAEDGESQKATLRQLAQRFAITVQIEEAEAPLAMQREPVMFYIDPTREGADSALWMWLRGQRPTAVLSTSIWPPETPARHRYEAASLVNERVSVSLGENRKTLDEEAATQRRLPTNFKPSPRPALRLQQFKRLAQRFEAVEDEVQGGPTRLRLLPVPIYHYLANDLPCGAAVFAFAHGTNPEVILSLEANESDPLGGWAYSLGAMAFARLSVSLDGEEVWTQPRFRKGKRRTMYTHGRLEEKRPDPNGQ